ncbi:Cerato-ulmin, partial [Colletotrichum shisoi]
MKLIAVFPALLASTAVAAPTNLKGTEVLEACVSDSVGGTGTIPEDISVLSAICKLGTPLCCPVNVAGVESLPCAAPSTAPVTIAGFQASCEANGDHHPKCCVLDV